MDNIFNDTDIKDQKLLEALLPYAKKTARSNLTEIKIDYATRKSSICFALLPEWAPRFPPFAIARLSAITKKAGYETHIFDVNVEAYNKHKSWNLDFDPWSDVYWSRWIDEDQYNMYMRDNLQVILDEFIDKIVKINPTAIGFTMYDCNKFSIKYVTNKLKELLPEIYVILGGPSCTRAIDMVEYSIYSPDYIVSGEGEELILQVLDEIEQGIRPKTPKLFLQDIGERINLDNVPPPDYSTFDTSLYQMPNGVLMEFSRGCIAKCVFCDETHFWKFRDRRALNVINEVVELHKRGVDSIFFIDSLVNGNLKELRAFAKGIIANDMKINWTGWMRCDGRMDNAYFKDLADSGLRSIAYGVESGSNKVLSDMNKQITNQEVEQNFKDGTQYGIYSNAMIILGFPTEFYNDFYHTMTLIWRIRKYNLNYVAGGIGLHIADDNIMGRNRHRYNVSDIEYQGSWIRNDFTNSKAHRMMRVKFFNIFLDNTKDYQGNIICLRHGIKSDYVLTADQQELDLDYEEVDFNICKPNINPFADSLVNEVWPLLRLFWKTRGAYSIEIKFNSEKDGIEFGQFLKTNLNAILKFNIDIDGNWSADFTYDYKQDENAWRYHYTSEVQTNAVKRIAIFSDENSFKKNLSWEEQQKICNEYNTNYDFSFNYNYQGTGKW